MTFKEMHTAAKLVITTAGYHYANINKFDNMEFPTGTANTTFFMWLAEANPSTIGDRNKGEKVLEIRFVGDARQDDYLDKIETWENLIKEIRSTIDSGSCKASYTDWKTYSTEIRGDYIIIIFQLKGDI